MIYINHLQCILKYFIGSIWLYKVTTSSTIHDSHCKPNVIMCICLFIRVLVFDPVYFLFDLVYLGATLCTCILNRFIRIWWCVIIFDLIYCSLTMALRLFIILFCVLDHMYLYLTLYTKYSILFVLFSGWRTMRLWAVTRGSRSFQMTRGTVSWSSQMLTIQTLACTSVCLKTLPERPKVLPAWGL